MAAAESPCWRPMTSRGLCSCKIGQALVSLIPTPARINYVGWDHEQDPTHFPTHLPSPPHCLLACAVPLCSQLQTSQMNRSRSWRFLDLPPSALHRSSSPVAGRTHACSSAWYACGQAAFLFFSPHNAPPRPSSTTARVRKVDECQKHRFAFFCHATIRLHRAVGLRAGWGSAWRWALVTSNGNGSTASRPFYEGVCPRPSLLSKVPMSQQAFAHPPQKTYPLPKACGKAAQQP